MSTMPVVDNLGYHSSATELHLHRCRKCGVFFIDVIGSKEHRIIDFSEAVALKLSGMKTHSHVCQPCLAKSRKESKCTNR